MQWKIENGMLFVRDPNSVVPTWMTPNAAEAAIALTAAVKAEREARAEHAADLIDIADSLEAAYGELPTHARPGPPTSIVAKLRQRAAAIRSPEGDR